MKNIHPADELAMIRADLRRLKEREAFLRRGFLTLRLPTRGEDAVASIKVVKQRRFRRDLLPKAVLDNADYWETEIIRHVHVDEAPKARGHIPGFVVEDADVQVIEPT
ncbi:MAG: hypothetical protein AAFQ64_13790 [Pseudomonadota bacterium]